MLKKIVFLGSLFVLSGCATVLTGSSNNVQLRVVDTSTQELLKDVKCSLTDNEGTVYLVAANPGSVIVNKGKGTLQVNCKKPGYSQQNMGIAQNINGVTFVNVLFWPGFIVDAVSGTMHKYPAQATIQMEKMNS